MHSLGPCLVTLFKCAPQDPEGLLICIRGLCPPNPPRWEELATKNVFD